MAEVEIRLHSNSETQGPERADFVVKLDELLEQYLNTLDAYQKAHEQLKEHLSSGFLSLAQANFNNHSGTWFGQDYYDERMRASRRVTVAEGVSKITFSVSTAPAESDEGKTADTEATSDAPGTPEGSEDVSSGSEKGAQADKEDNTTSQETKPPADPLRWFGVLVPPALRVTQSSFAAGVEGPVARLATLTVNLKKQEIEIGRLRKQIKRL